MYTKFHIINELAFSGSSEFTFVDSIGETKAMEIEAWLLAHETTLRLALRSEVYARHPAHRPLVEHVDARGARHLGGVPGALLVARKTDVVPLDRFLLPADLDGSVGRFRAREGSCLIEARNDLEAILTWVKSRRGLTPAQRARRRARGGSGSAEPGAGVNESKFRTIAMVNSELCGRKVFSCTKAGEISFPPGKSMRRVNDLQKQRSKYRTM